MIAYVIAAVITAALVLSPGAAFAYVGPGAGLGLIGSLIAVVLAVCVTLFGIVLFPFMMIRKRRKAKAAAETADSGPPG